MNEAGTADAGNRLAWSVRLYESAPEKRYVLLAIAMFAAAGGWFLFQNVVYPLLAILAILGSTTEFWLPIHYVMDEKGASARCGISVSAIEWSDVKLVHLSENSAKLSPIEGNSRLGEFRGVTIRFGDRKDEALDWIRNKVAEGCLISGAKS